MAGAAGVNTEQFEAYFRRADLDQDGKISGAEAVAFLQSSNLPKQVLAQIWMHADQSHTGYLSRPEFYNFLKLVTVAQSKRELTPDIVKAALYGPASGKIPAPKINLAATPAPQSKSVGASPPLQMGAAASASSNNLGLRGLTPSTSINQQFGQVQSTTGNQQLGQAPPSSGMNQQFSINQQFRQVPPSTNMNPQFGQPLSSTNMNQQFFSSQGNQPIRPLPMPAATASRPSPGPGGLNFPRGGDMVGPGLPNSNNDWLGGRISVAPTGTTPVSNRGASPSILPVAPKSLDPLSTMSSTAAKDPKALVGSGNGFASESMFGGDVFSTIQSSSLQVSSAPTQPASGITTGPQPSAKPDPFEAFQSTLMKPSTMGQPQQSSSLPKSDQQISTQVTSLGSSSGAPAGVGNSASEQSLVSWPKMTRASVQKYAKVFVEVDTDRDGKITGEQARSLFLSWRLPIEVLKQVWDLSDQDSDSMLSLREFCIALYLMERYREGRPLPSALPSSIMLDETLLSLTGPPTAAYGSMGWGATAGIRPQQTPPGAQPIASAGLRPPTQTVYSQPDGMMQFNEQNARGPLMDNSYTSELGNVEENSLHNKVQEAESDEKVENKEIVILDSREKIEFYRTKMQDLVLYKSRCDNRLNEITERALSDKHEAELLAKKYEEKYKQVAEIASKLTIEEASFREIQGRKMELQQAIIKMEQGGSADGILQVRADRIQSDLEELLKAMTERCKKHDLQIKSTALIELPPGWQPGIPEFVSIWDEDWDKFEDEGFSFDVAVPANSKSTSVHEENSLPTHNFSPDSRSNADATSGKPISKGVSAFETESSYAHSEDESKSPQGSPARQTTFESPSPKYSENDFRKSSDGDAETHRSFDEPAWGTFDNNDDIDSVWGFSAKASDHGKHEEKYFFGSSDFGASPERTDSPQKNSPFAFENSVPGSPLSRAGNSPPRDSVESRDPLWQQAMTDELSALHKTDTWDLVSLPPSKHAIGSRWVYKIKTKSDGSVERYKARLVAKGFNQQYGLDYEETFAPVAKMTTVRTLIAVASVRQWSLSQLDVKNAFLNGNLQEEVYMVPPPGLSHSVGYVCKLKKALYGLKQAPRAWFEKFSTVVTSFGFTSSQHDSALFFRCTSAGRILLLLYVDDMIITGDDVDGIADLKSELAGRFEMKDLGALSYFLGIEVAYSPRGYLLSQSKYTMDIIERATLTDTKTVDTPLESNARYSPSDGVALTDPTLYRTIVGCLVYLTITRPDIAYAVHIVSQFVSAPTTVHWAAVVRILRYLRGTCFQSLLFPSTSSLVLRAYSDADWASNPTDRKSTTGFLYFFG